MRKCINKFIYLFATAYIICCALNASAQSTAEALTTLLNSIHTMQANFTQTVYDNKGKAIQTSYGKMALQRPGKFRWQVTKPIPQLIIANESRLFIYDSDLQQLTIRALNETAGDAPALFLSHPNADIEKNFAIKTLSDKDGLQWYSLTSKSADSSFSSIKMGFANNAIKEMQLQDQLGHTTKIKFNDASLNTSLSAALFTFKPPANVDVIDETRKH